MFCLLLTLSLKNNSVHCLFHNKSTEYYDIYFEVIMFGMKDNTFLILVLIKTFLELLFFIKWTRVQSTEKLNFHEITAETIQYPDMKKKEAEGTTNWKDEWKKMLLGPLKTQTEWI